MKNTLSKSLIATKTLENAVDVDLFSVVQKYGHDDHEVLAMINHVHSIIEVTMGSLRAKLLKLEHELNELDEKREEKRK